MSIGSDLGTKHRDRFFALSLDMLCIAGFDGYFKELNPAWERTLGWSVRELEARPFIEFVHPDDREATIAEAASLQNSNNTVWFENRYRCKDGSYAWLAWRATASLEDRLYYAVARDITQQKAAERAVVEERNRLSAVLSSIADGAIITDAYGRIVSINPAMERLGGWEDFDVRGRLVSEAYPATDEKGDRIPVQNRMLTQALLSRQPVHSRGFGISYRIRDGRLLPVHVSAAPVLDPNGELMGAVCVVRDVSHEREVDELKSTLISTVSHELRTPLTMIIGFTDLLERKVLDQTKTDDALHEIHDAAKRLARLIEALLSVARIESGRMTAHPVTVAVQDSLNRVIRHMPETRQIRVQLQPGSVVFADPDHLTQILLNLVSNAIKYSPEDAPVAVRTSVTEGRVEISVADHGAGLTNREIARLFQKFSRIDRPDVRNVPGTGLGLYITKCLVEMQRGTIRVDSAPGRGSVFTVALPAAEDA